MALTLPAVAQDVVERAALEHCASLGSAADRLACFESLVSDTKPETEASGAAVPAAAAPEPPSLAPAAAQPIPDTRDSTQEYAQEPTTVALADEVGIKHLDRDRPKKEAEPKPMVAVVKRVQKKANRLLYFEFDNGQVWRQMESGYFPYPRDDEFEVSIRQGVMGDYQMRVDNRGRMLRIVRVK